MPTATWKSRLRSGSAHWDLELAVEVRQCPLGSGARGGVPAVPTGIWTARRRRRRRWRRRMRRRRTALIKSNNPHLAGGELKSHLTPLFELDLMYGTFLHPFVPLHPTSSMLPKLWRSQGRPSSSSEVLRTCGRSGLGPAIASASIGGGETPLGFPK